MKVLDKSNRWIIISVLALGATFVLHALANGWVGPWSGHNLYNDPATAWIGTYPVDVIPVLAAIVIVQIVGLLWEWFEFAYFGTNPSGFIQVDLRDTLFDETMDLVGAAVAVWVGEHVI